MILYFILQLSVNFFSISVDLFRFGIFREGRKSQISHNVYTLLIDKESRFVLYYNIDIYRLIQKEVSVLKKIFLALAAAAFCLAFSGCTVFETDTEALMRPPVFTEEQEKLNAALTEVIGESYTLKYPANGDMNSAFIFEDLDGDKTEEALAFYSLLDESTRINILKKDGEGWISVYEAAGYYGDIEKVDFTAMDSRGKVLVVKWEQEAAIYRYEDERLVTVHRTNCEESEIADIDGDGYSEIIVFGSNILGRNVLNVIYSDNGEIIVSGDITTEYANIFSAREGRLYSEKSAYFIDSTVSVYGGVVYLTEIITLEEGTAKRYYIADFVEYDDSETGGEQDSGSIVIVDSDYGKRAIFLRGTKVSCMDTNGDGIMEMPVELREDYSRTETDELFFIQYMQYDGEISVPVWNGIANTENGYLFAVPESWNERVEVMLASSGDEVIFTDTETGEEILRIFAVLKSDYQDKYEDYILCAQDEAKYYYITSAAEPESDFYIAPEIYEKCFIFI